MAINVDDALIKKLEKLSKLELTSEEEKRIESDLTEILSYMSQIDEVDVSGVTEMYSPITDELKTVLHDDSPKSSETRDKIINEFPESRDGYLRIPGIHN